MFDHFSILCIEGLIGVYRPEAMAIVFSEAYSEPSPSSKMKLFPDQSTAFRR